MMRQGVTERDLRRQLLELGERHPKLAEDDLFVLWFLRAFLTDTEDEARKALCGGANEKGVDAALIDDASKNISLVQGKLRRKVGAKAEKRADILGFAELATYLANGGQELKDLLDGMSPDVAEKLRISQKRIAGGYRLSLYYVTLGKCSGSLIKEATRKAQKSAGVFHFFGGHQILLLLSDYLDGVAPPVPLVDLEIEESRGSRGSTVFARYDPETDIEAWVFSSSHRTIADLYSHGGPRLFARNVRGFLGRTEINRGMEATLEHEPAYFWYYNNGITIVCDDAQQIRSRGTERLRITNPQIINGQQTTYTLARMDTRRSRASVLVRVIRVPRGSGPGSDRFETLVSQIVAATNNQNAIRASDLMSNDRRQVDLERQLRKIGFWYNRKRQPRSETKRLAGSHAYVMVDKEEVAQAVAACELDPSILREGKEGLFEERWYFQIFPSSDPHFYLSRLFLKREVQRCAKGFPERGYAKWLVVHFLWSRVGPLVRSKSRAEALRRSWERDGEAIRAISQPATIALRTALQFYRLRRGKGAKAIDAVSFFKLRGLHDEFEHFWRSRHNAARPAFTKAWRRFERALAKEATS